MITKFNEYLLNEAKKAKKEDKEEKVAKCDEKDEKCDKDEKVDKSSKSDEEKYLSAKQRKLPESLKKGIIKRMKKSKK
jgi:hypothetical protein